MVARISSGSSLFGAIKYNQKKVDEGVAEVLFSQNIIRPLDGSYNIPLCMQSFEPYLAANNKTLNPVIHISLNPHPDDKLTDEQLATIAREYMDKLGYGKQPFLVYKHNDLARGHIHIVSIRVKEDGSKIDDSFEKRRSERIRKQLEQKYNLIPAKKNHIDEWTLKRVDPKAGDIKKQVSNTVKGLMEDYHFRTIHEFKALLSLYGITVEEVKGEVRNKPYNGLVYSVITGKGEKVGNPIKASLIGKSVGYEALQKHMEKSKVPLADKQLKERNKRFVSNAMANCSSRKDFEKRLAKDKISVVFRENDDKRIYGVTFIDHEAKAVLNGSHLGKEFSANSFHELFSGQSSNKSQQEDKSYSNDSHATNGYDKEQDSVAESIAGIFSMEQHGDNYEEIAFANRMKRKKKKRKGFGL
ncbi:relaxase/mobilization nuclease-like protein [Dysgonomonas alginatilytica]|uniref:Relaxase/mobilization nuclease-like protein n=1 Tax=Dysgonomonas alginatilytica TaxID=1605892 RepID=A0A2V3PJD1_9BACT|nr:conjugal transfer protein MobB [Dysgonomonas alginatilytica]PXV57138.1 relaxase/mobilization nuclease-like protein [Dysgonomonas alginatilytica]